MRVHKVFQRAERYEAGAILSLSANQVELRRAWLDVGKPAAGGRTVCRLRKGFHFKVGEQLGLPETAAEEAELQRQFIRLSAAEAAAGDRLLSAVDLDPSRRDTSVADFSLHLLNREKRANRR